MDPSSRKASEGKGGNVRKMLSLLCVAFVLLVGVVPVRAQGILRGGYMPSSPDGWYYYLQGDQVHMLQADTMNWIGETMNIGRRAQFRRVTDDLIGYGPYFGLQGSGSRGFYPMYQCSSKGRRWERGIGTAFITTAIGAAVAGKKGALIGAGVGGGYALYKDASCRPVQNQMVVIDDPSDLTNGGVVPMPQVSSGRENRENGWNQRLRNQANSGNSWFGNHRGCQEQGMFTLKNESGEAVRVFQNGKPFAVLQSRQSECGDPFAEYDAEMVVAVSDGYTARVQIVRAKPEGRQGGIWVWQ